MAPEEERGATFAVLDLAVLLVRPKGKMQEQLSDADHPDFHFSGLGLPSSGSTQKLRK